MLRHVRPTTRAATQRGASWYAAFVLVALLASFLQLTQAPAPAQAATVATFPAPDLLNPRVVADATPAQADALRRFQAQAVDLTLAHYGLPAGDREAVKSWGRTEAQAMLWGLMVQAVQTPGAERSADQWNVRHWLAALTKHEVEETARATGLEYAKWAGLDLDTYRRLAKSGSETELRNFFALPGSLIGGSTANCAYAHRLPTRARSTSHRAAFSRHPLPSSSPGGVPPRSTSPPGTRSSPRASPLSRASSTPARSTWVLVVTRLRPQLRQRPFAPARPDSPCTTRPPRTPSQVVTSWVTSLSCPCWLPGHGSVFTDLRKRFTPRVGRCPARSSPTCSRCRWGHRWPPWWFARGPATPHPSRCSSFADSQTVLFSLFVGATLPAPLTFANCDNSLIPLALYGSPHLAWANIIDPALACTHKCGPVPA